MAEALQAEDFAQLLQRQLGKVTSCSRFCRVLLLDQAPGFFFCFFDGQIWKNIPGLVNLQKTNWKITIFIAG